jgi:hypothetical protein
VVTARETPTCQARRILLESGLMKRFYPFGFYFFGFPARWRRD